VNLYSESWQWFYIGWGVDTTFTSPDDLGTGRGVVLGRAVATLRSVETHPLDWRI
jgi:hypothetical protein